MGFDYEITYRSGKENIAADALFRRDEEGRVFLQALAVVIFNGFRC